MVAMVAMVAMMLRLADRSRGLTLTNAVVLRPDLGVARSLRIVGGRIAGIGAAPARGDLVVDCRGAAILPGLINAHDHLELNSFGRLKWRTRHENVREWIADFQPRFATDPALASNRPDTLDDRLFVGGLKNLLCGVTTVCHHNPLYRRLRTGFPVRVVRQFGWSHSLGIDGEQLGASYRRTPSGWPWIVHAAEGVDEGAAAELGEMDRLGCVGANTVLVHGVGLTPSDRALAIARGCALVWCPSSNEFLFGKTADVRAFSANGLLALGSDSRLSGDGDLIDEIRAARGTGLLPAHDLIRAVTSDAARALRLRHAGALVEGAPADVAVFPAGSADPLDAVLASRRADVRLVLLDGRPLVGDPDFADVFDVARTSATRVRLDGRAKLLASTIARQAQRAAIRETGLDLEVAA